MNGNRSEPLSIETLLKKQREEKEAASKPKFLTKEQRAQIAIEKREGNGEALEREAGELERQHNQGGRYGGGGRYDDRDRGFDRDRSGRQDYQNRDRRGGGDDRRNAAPPPPPPPPLPNNFVPNLSETDLSAIRSRYLGVDKKKRKIRKMNDRKFDDTLAEDSLTAVGSNRQGAQIMFGRGHIAGMDDYGGAPPPASRARAAASTAAGVGGGGLIGRLPKQGYDDRHWTEKPLEEMKERDWRIFREDFSISARGWQYPSSSEKLEGEIGYKEPSPIQRQAIPIGLQNRDIIGIAETGEHLGPYALIMAPTRELAQQIESEAKKFASPLGYKCVSIVGGRAVEEQQFNLREGAEIIIATPGRLKDVLERRVLVLSQCRYIVMDEADRMVHLGFEVDLTYILDALPTDTMTGEGEDALDRMDVDGDTKKGRTRVTTLFSATMPPAVERLARKYLRKPATITIGEAGRAVDTVEQRVEFVNGDEKKKQRVLEILNSNQYPSPIIVFVNQKKTADMVAKDLSRGGWSTATLHSGKNQEGREAALQSLRSGEADVLVATDLAGRGIDVQDVSLVINYQMAGTIEAYVHRIGRTGRAGKLGTAITFLTNDDDEVMYDLKQEISKSPGVQGARRAGKARERTARVSREMKRKRETEDVG
ncbi:P-loop containing nucleoside triphosphate hydrolase protein [Ephemerocybe angulata]|uniref:RNA helicase n=1 Tax=Ephemerocybe angulata TaxID=980116 RepID=A0A8H6MHC6_9AGAR|nr:P-loop containing nucleoside triphosphate hydrolase protein [Tulosesus angulatus]